MNCSRRFFASHFSVAVSHRNHLDSLNLVHGNYCMIENVNFCLKNHHDVHNDVLVDSFENVVLTVIDSAVMEMRAAVAVAAAAELVAEVH